MRGPAHLQERFPVRVSSERQRALSGAINHSFMKWGEYGNAGGNPPAGITWRQEMSYTHLVLVLKILAILELLIKAVVIYLTR